MSLIQILSESLINKIAAGEVVERPASVVKELVENAIDAGSDQIFVTINNGGKDYISVLDNGRGMTAEDAKLAIERHATSKIATHEDLENIQSMGFRGEALAAISAVSKFELTTCGNEEEGGFQIRVEGGSITHSARMGFPRGTRIIVENLFYNTPARQKFMKSTNTEYNHIHEFIIRIALGYPGIQFRLTHNRNLVLNIPRDTDFGTRISHCLGADIANDLIECEHEESYLSFSGYISHPTKSKASKRWQHIFVNDRYVKCNTVTHAIYAGYRSVLMKNMHPMFFINIHLSPTEVDVNVHPSKTEIRLKNQNLIHTILSEKISQQLKHGERDQFLKQVRKPSPGMENDEIESEEQKQQAEPAPKVVVQTDDQMSFSATSSTVKKESKPASADLSEPGTEEPAKPAAATEMETDGLSEIPPRKAEIPIPKAEVPVSPENESRTAGQSFNIIGQLHNKYILIQGEDRLIVIDQHAAHERIRFEEIREQFYSNTLQTQPLLIPIMIELSPQDGIFLEQFADSWKKLGFIIDHFGGNDYSVKEIPNLLKDADIAKIIKQVLDETAQFGKSGKLEEFFNEAFESMACHSAIRASQKLSMEEMQALLKQLVEYDILLHCPHGRPVMIEFSLDELDRRFKR